MWPIGWLSCCIDSRPFYILYWIAWPQRYQSVTPHWPDLKQGKNIVWELHALTLPLKLVCWATALRIRAASTSISSSRRIFSVAQHRLLSNDSYSYAYICIFIPSHRLYIIYLLGFTTQSWKPVSPRTRPFIIICDMLFYQHSWWILSLLLSFLSPVLCHAYRTKYLIGWAHHTDRLSNQMGVAKFKW